jgi:hypothetical protein
MLGYQILIFNLETMIWMKHIFWMKISIEMNRVVQKDEIMFMSEIYHACNLANWAMMQVYEAKVHRCAIGQKVHRNTTMIWNVSHAAYCIWKLERHIPHLYELFFFHPAPYKIGTWSEFEKMHFLGVTN